MKSSLFATTQGKKAQTENPHPSPSQNKLSVTEKWRKSRSSRVTDYLTVSQYLQQRLADIRSTYHLEHILYSSPYLTHMRIDGISSITLPLVSCLTFFCLVFSSVRSSIRSRCRQRNERKSRRRGSRWWWRCRGSVEVVAEGVSLKLFLPPND